MISGCIDSMTCADPILPVPERQGVPRDSSAGTTENYADGQENAGTRTAHSIGADRNVRSDDIIRSIIGSQALASVALTGDQVARALDEAYQEPLEAIG